MNPSDPNDRLRAALETWRVSPPPNPGFRPAVWERIQRRAQETWASYVRTHLVGWSVAAMFAIAAAGWTGHAVAQARIEDGREEMVVTYLGNLDPRVMAKLRP